MKTATIVAEGLYFGEGPRWHEGRLWFSDFFAHAVKSMDADGNVRIEHHIDDQPSGLGWLPDGRLLVVAMKKLQVLRQEGDGFVVHADLSELARFRCNDMVVDAKGRAWVGNFGFDLDGMMAEKGVEGVFADPPTANLVRVDPDGSVHLASPDMHFPNGPVITPDGKTLILAETMAMCLTAFDIAADGQLENRRVWAPVGMRAPDGICLNAEGNIWVANALANECVLFAPGGEVLDTVTTSQNCIACALGGEDGKDLFILTAHDTDAEIAAAEPRGRVERVRVEVGAAS